MRLVTGVKNIALEKERDLAACEVETLRVRRILTIHDNARRLLDASLVCRSSTDPGSG